MEEKAKATVPLAIIKDVEVEYVDSSFGKRVEFKFIGLDGVTELRFDTSVTTAVKIKELLTKL